MIRSLEPHEQTRDAKPVTLEDIQSLCKALRTSCDAGEKVVNEFEAEKLALEKRFAGRFVKAADNIRADMDELLIALATSRDLFRGAKKTETFFGFRVGFMKKPGKVVVVDEADTIARIEKLLSPKEQSGLLKVTKSLVKKGLSALPGDLLKKLGVTLEADTEAPFVKAEEGDAMKRLNALIQQDGEEAK